VHIEKLGTAFQVAQIAADFPVYIVANPFDHIALLLLVCKQRIKMGADNVQQFGISGRDRAGQVRLGKNNAIELPIEIHRAVEKPQVPWLFPRCRVRKRN